MSALAACGDPPQKGWGRDDPDAAVVLWEIPSASFMPVRSAPALDLPNAGSGAMPGGGNRPARPFGEALRLGFDISPRAIAVGHLTDDDRLDIAVADGATLHVLAQTAARTFVLERSFDLSGTVAKDSLIAADLNGDGHDDLAINLGRAVAIAYFRNGGLDPLVTLHVPAPAADSFGLAYAKLGTDGRNDLVALTETAALVYKQLEAGAFAAPLVLKDAAGMRGPILVSDFDADGRDDIVSGLKAEKLECLLARSLPNDQIAAPRRCGLAGRLAVTPTGDEGFGAADIDGDGGDDLIVSRFGTLAVLSLSKDTLSFAANTPNTPTAGPVLTGDVNGDATLDVLVEHDGELHLHVNYPKGQLGRAVPIAAPTRRLEDPTGILRDIDGDGQQDLLLGRQDGLYMLYGRDAEAGEPLLPDVASDNACVEEPQSVLVTGCDPQCLRRPEICNAQDDDCDGAIDEDSTGVACGAGVGECSVGQISACEKGSAKCSGKTPTDETCDHLDNDCDGRVDETEACDPCRGPHYLAGSVIAQTDADLAALADVTCIGGQFQIKGSAISDLGPLSKLRAVVEDMWVLQTEKLASLNGLSALERAGRLLVRENTGLTTLVGIETLRRIDTDHLSIDNNSKLLDLNGLDGLEHVEAGLLIYDNFLLYDIRGLRNLRQATDIDVHRNPSLPKCQVDALIAQLDTKITCSQCDSNGVGSCEK